MLDAMKEKDNAGARPNFVINKRGAAVAGTVTRSGKEQFIHTISSY